MRVCVCGGGGGAFMKCVSAKATKQATAQATATSRSSAPYAASGEQTHHTCKLFSHCCLNSMVTTVLLQGSDIRGGQQVRLRCLPTHCIQH